jgi:hypothetical protein
MPKWLALLSTVFAILFLFICPEQTKYQSKEINLPKSEVKETFFSKL